MFYISDKVTSFFMGQEQTTAANLETEEFEATVFQLCADSAKVTDVVLLFQLATFKDQ